MSKSRIFMLLLTVLSYVAEAQNVLLIGTYTGTGSKGIYAYRFDTATGKASFMASTDSASNPSFLAVNRSGDRVYAANENGGGNGRISAYAFDKRTGSFNLLNTQPSYGDHTCHVALHPSERYLAAANYNGANFVVYGLSADGALSTLLDSVRYTGSSANESRQKSPHPHSVNFSPDGLDLMVPDLGTDRLNVHDFFDVGDNPPQLVLKLAYVLPQVPGSGPRHFTFSPNGKHAYLINELTGSVVHYRYTRGKLKKQHELSTHPPAFAGRRGSADIHLSPDGKFLYASNRGDANTLTIFRVDKKGRLHWQDYVSTLGIHPRNFTIHPSGRYLLVANRDSDAVTVFRRDAKTGALQDSGQRIPLPRPVCLVWVP